jgi:hypothetical protein
MRDSNDFTFLMLLKLRKIRIPIQKILGVSLFLHYLCTGFSQKGFC